MPAPSDNIIVSNPEKKSLKLYKPASLFELRKKILGGVAEHSVSLVKCVAAAHDLEFKWTHESASEIP